MTGAPINEQHLLTADAISRAAAKVKAQKVQFLVWDAIHKCPSQLVEFVDQVLRLVTKVDAPFGGVPLIGAQECSRAESVQGSSRLGADAIVFTLNDQFGVDEGYRTAMELLAAGVIYEDVAERLIDEASVIHDDDAVVLVRTRVEKRCEDGYRLDSLEGTHQDFFPVVETLSTLDAQDVAMAMQEADMSRVLSLKVGARAQLMADCGPLFKYALVNVVKFTLDPPSATVVDCCSGEQAMVTPVKRHVVCHASYGEEGNEENADPHARDRYEAWTFLPLRLAYAFTPQHASSLALSKIHVCMSTDLRGDNFLYKAFGRARRWEDITWQLPTQPPITTADELAAAFKLRLSRRM